MKSANANKVKTCCEYCDKAVRSVIDKSVVYYCPAMSRISTGTLECSVLFMQEGGMGRAAAVDEAAILSSEATKARDAPRKRI